MKDETTLSAAKPLGRGMQRLYVLLLSAVLLLPAAVFLVIRGFVDTTNYEQRTLAVLPCSREAEEAGMVTTAETFPSQLEDWFNDHLPFRNQLLTLQGLLEYKVLKTSSSDSVIVGKDGWLFYKGAQVADEDPVGDYMGTNLFTEEELQRIADNFTAARDELADRGCDFVIYFAPNKERIYSEYMPDMYGKPAENFKLRQLLEYLQTETDLKVVCALDDLTAYREQNPDTEIYYKYDTHWNNLGAYIGSEKLVQALGYDFVPLEEVTVTDYHTGSYDLARLIHLGNTLNDCAAYQLTGYTGHPMTSVQEDDGHVFRFTTTDGQAPGGKLFVIGDSFSTMMAPYLACHYAQAYTTFYYTYSHGQLLREEPDVVVYEAVERYVGNMLNFTLSDGYQGSNTE